MKFGPENSLEGNVPDDFALKASSEIAVPLLTEKWLGMQGFRGPRYQGLWVL